MRSLLLSLVLAATAAHAAPGRITRGQWILQVSIHDIPVAILLDLERGEAMIDGEDGRAAVAMERYPDGSFALDFGFGLGRYEIVQDSGTKICSISAAPKCMPLQAAPH